MPPENDGYSLRRVRIGRSEHNSDAVVCLSAERAPLHSKKGTLHHVGTWQNSPFSLVCRRSLADSVLYEMLVGEPPFRGSTPQAVLGKIITGETPSATAERASVPPNVEVVIRRALEKVPADRFARADQFVTALSDVGFAHGGVEKDESATRGLWNQLSITLAVLVARSWRGPRTALKTRSLR